MKCNSGLYIININFCIALELYITHIVIQCKHSWSEWSVNLVLLGLALHLVVCIDDYT